VLLWQAVVAVSFGVVLGELIFGGRGFGFVSPATIAIAVLLISFPQIALPVASAELAIASLPGGALLLLLGLVSWRVMLSVVAAAGLALLPAGVDPVAVATALAFGLVFLICEPTSAASTNPGRWVYGALAGGLCVLFSPSGMITTEGLIFAALMSSIFAPLIDHIVILAHGYWRQRRHHA
jgi:Na+-transporting NADH:ubiquinone oxidoreductase subunit B